MPPPAGADTAGETGPHPKVNRTSRKMRRDLANELDDAMGLAAVRIEVCIVDDKAPATTPAGFKRRHHNFRERPPRQSSGKRHLPRSAACGELLFLPIRDHVPRAPRARQGPDVRQSRVERALPRTQPCAAPPALQPGRGFVPCHRTVHRQASRSCGPTPTCPCRQRKSAAGRTSGYRPRSPSCWGCGSARLWPRCPSTGAACR